jgi:hypothetical protein
LTTAPLAAGTVGVGSGLGSGTTASGGISRNSQCSQDPEASNLTIRDT